MGANGSNSTGILKTEAGRRWKTVEVLPNGVKVIQFKTPTPGKMPEESHSPNSVYAMMEKNGKGLKSIAIYDSDCKKIAEIHTADHHGSGPHYHKWSNGRPMGDAIPIGKSPKYQKLLIETLNLL